MARLLQAYVPCCLLLTLPEVARGGKTTPVGGHRERMIPDVGWGVYRNEQGSDTRMPQ